MRPDSSRQHSSESSSSSSRRGEGRRGKRGRDGDSDRRVRRGGRRRVEGIGSEQQDPATRGDARDADMGVVTPAVDSGGGTKVAEAELERLRQVVKNMKQQLRHATEMRSVRARGKNVGRKHLKALMGPDDEDNLRNVTAYLRKTFFPWVKMLPPNWHVYSVAKSKTVCSRVMTRVRVPSDMSEPSYWDNYVAIWVNDRMVTMRSNFKESCRRQYLGELSAVNLSHMDQT